MGEEGVVIVFACAVSSGDCEHFSGTGVSKEEKKREKKEGEYRGEKKLKVFRTNVALVAGARCVEQK